MRFTRVDIVKQVMILLIRNLSGYDPPTHPTHPDTQSIQRPKNYNLIKIEFDSFLNSRAFCSLLFELEFTFVQIVFEVTTQKISVKI